MGSKGRFGEPAERCVVSGAIPIGEETLQGVTAKIQVMRTRPSVMTQVTMQSDAELLASCLRRHLPQGTLNRLTAKMLGDRAGEIQVCCQSPKVVGMVGFINRARALSEVLYQMITMLIAIREGLGSVIVESGSESARQSAIIDITVTLNILRAFMGEGDDSMESSQTGR